MFFLFSLLFIWVSFGCIAILFLYFSAYLSISPLSIVLYYILHNNYINPLNAEYSRPMSSTFLSNTFSLD